jgi:2-iminobutanoate/2-iminopropanoate deaminase
MNKQVISIDSSSPGSLPLSPAIGAGSFVFLSGQVAVDRSTSKFTEGDAPAQTHQILKNIGELLQAAGSSLAQVVKVTVYLSDIKDFSAFNDVYRTYFPTEPPARTTVQATLIPPYGVEIDVIAVRDVAPE